MPSSSKTNYAPNVHAALAAAMSDPNLLESWRRNPVALRDIRINEQELDLEQVRNFIGLVTKVRHNDLRIVLPATFRLIDRAGLSIPLFADYAVKSTALRTSGKPTQDQKLEALAGHLNGWLDKDDPIHSLAWDVFRHEYSILLLRQSQQSVRPQAGIGIVRSSTVPRHNGLVFHHEMTCRPSEVETILQDRNCNLNQVPRRLSSYAYFGDERSGRIRISEIDEVSFVILDLADGSRSVGNIANMLRAAGVSVRNRQLCEIIQQLASSGMLATANRAG
jgi:hypothetical protein